MALTHQQPAAEEDALGQEWPEGRCDLVRQQSSREPPQIEPLATETRRSPRRWNFATKAAASGVGGTMISKLITESLRHLHKRKDRDSGLALIVAAE
jgi:hypothetical protein